MDTKVQKPTRNQQKAPPVWNEPFEIAEDVVEQVTGSRPPQETQPVSQGASSQKQAKPALDEKKKDVTLMAHKRELEEMITQKRSQRQQDLQARWQEPTEEQAQKQEEAQQPSPLVEPPSKQKRGIFGGFMGSLRKKQRSVELPKTPTN